MSWIVDCELVNKGRKKTTVHVELQPSIIVRDSHFHTLNTNQQTSLFQIGELPLGFCSTTAEVFFTAYGLFCQPTALHLMVKPQQRYCLFNLKSHEQSHISFNVQVYCVVLLHSLLDQVIFFHFWFYRPFSERTFWFFKQKYDEQPALHLFFFLF